MTARRFTGPLVAVTFLFAASLLPAANLLVPSLELVTRGFMNAGTFELASMGDFDLAIEGGYKFGGSIGFSYIDANASLEDDDPDDRLTFDGINIIVRDVFKLPLSLSWFVGTYDVFASGSEFPVSFGTAEIASAYSGFMYFPTGVQYDGIHQVKGTGLRISSMPVPDKLLLLLYLYQDSWFLDGIGDFEPGHWSADMRVLANLAAIKLEGFLGWSYVPTAVAGWFRAGVLFHASMKSIEVLAELGLPKWDPVADPFSINLFSLLFEPRLHLGLFNVAATFFWHPEYYHQEETLELGTFDVNLNLFFGDLSKTTTFGGLEGNLDFDSVSGTFLFKLAPYVSFATPGAVWKIKVNTKLLPFDMSDMFEGFVGVRASF
jgi:hypothetical protein